MILTLASTFVIAACSSSKSYVEVFEGFDTLLTQYPSDPLSDVCALDFHTSLKSSNHVEGEVLVGRPVSVGEATDAGLTAVEGAEAKETFQRFAGDCGGCTISAYIVYQLSNEKVLEYKGSPPWKFAIDLKSSRAYSLFVYEAHGANWQFLPVYMMVTVYGE
jgi:hypothetical protein